MSNKMSLIRYDLNKKTVLSGQELFYIINLHLDINISQWIWLQAASHEIKQWGFFFLSIIAVALLSLGKLENSISLSLPVLCFS